MNKLKDLPKYLIANALMFGLAVLALLAILELFVD